MTAELLSKCPEIEQKFDHSLEYMEPHELLTQAENAYPDVERIDHIEQELASRNYPSLQDDLAMIADIRRRMQTVLESNKAVSRQTIVPQRITLMGNDGHERQFYFTALALAETEKMTDEDKAQATLAACGFKASIQTCTYINGERVSVWCEDTPSKHVRLFGASALVI